VTRYGTTWRDGASRAFRLDGDDAALLPAADVGELLANPDLLHLPGDRIPVPAADTLAPPVLKPGKFVCVGLNYREHVTELGKAVPEYPTLFAKFATALIGAREPIAMPAPDVTAKVDWEAELVIVIGRRVHRADLATARAAIFGYTAMNDVSMRDWQRRTEEWLQGKNFDRSTPVGPWVVTADELDPAAGLAVQTRIGERIVQLGRTDDLIFGPAQLVAYISTVMTLEPGDLIATGTPAGVGVSRTPPEFLQAGDELITSVEGIGELRNRCEPERAAA
jgi:acylpyruvate hydrolase